MQLIADGLAAEAEPSNPTHTLVVASRVRHKDYLKSKIPPLLPQLGSATAVGSDPRDPVSTPEIRQTYEKPLIFQAFRLLTTHNLAASC